MSNLFAFHGVDNKVGTTMISQSIAETIANNYKDVKVLMASMNGRSGTEYVERVGESIEGLKIYLDNHVLSSKELMNSSRQRENFYLLGGVESIGQSRSFYPEMAVYFLNCIVDDFDIIIVDTGNDLDQGLAIGALEHIKQRFCVITQQEAIISRYEKLKDVYSKLNIEFSAFIINKYMGNDPYSIEYIKDRLGSNVLMMKVSMTEYGRQAEMEYRTLINYRNESYNKDITDIANIILKASGKPPLEKHRKKLWKAFI